jgi:hypothetical protein
VHLTSAIYADLRTGSVMLVLAPGYKSGPATSSSHLIESAAIVWKKRVNGAAIAIITVAPLLPPSARPCLGPLTLSNHTTSCAASITEHTTLVGTSGIDREMPVDAPSQGRPARKSPVLSSRARKAV